jgi:hypothetical protein
MSGRDDPTPPHVADLEPLTPGTEDFARVSWALSPTMRRAVENGKLAPDTLRVVLAGITLRRFPRGIGRVLSAHAITLGTKGSRDRAREVVKAERTLEAAGFAFDLETGRVKRTGSGAQGGRTLLRDMVDALLEVPGAPKARNTKEVREWLSQELEPFLPPEETDPRKDRPLDNALDAALDALRQK